MILDIILLAALLIEGWLLYVATQKAKSVASLKYEINMLKYSNEDLEERLGKASSANAKLKIENDLLKKEKRDVDNKMNEIIKALRRGLDK